MKTMDKLSIARRIDHTLLKPEATENNIATLCTEAVTHGFRSVCVNSIYVPLCAGLLAGTKVLVASVVGFPFGAALGQALAFEAKGAVAYGATEIDMVIPIGMFLSGNYTTTANNISAVVRTIDDQARVKVILGTDYLATPNLIVRACHIAKDAGAAMVKTCTGYGPGGATVADVKLMAETVHPWGMLVKASGKVRTLEDVLAMVEAGADVIGTSSGVQIVTGAAPTPATY